MSEHTDPISALVLDRLIAGVSPERLNYVLANALEVVAFTQTNDVPAARAHVARMLMGLARSIDPDAVCAPAGLQ